mmetsp:Transcript_65716/g.140575  ORF Transcript_65716/g.140575 Transcript_65716/m.140575 type:complete len:238 (-) Transcript_65716:16-729(-)
MPRTSGTPCGHTTAGGSHLLGTRQARRVGDGGRCSDADSKLRDGSSVHQVICPSGRNNTEILHGGRCGGGSRGGHRRSLDRVASTPGSGGTEDLYTSACSAASQRAAGAQHPSRGGNGCRRRSHHPRRPQQSSACTEGAGCSGGMHCGTHAKQPLGAAKRASAGRQRRQQRRRSSASLQWGQENIATTFCKHQRRGNGHGSDNEDYTVPCAAWPPLPRHHCCCYASPSPRTRSLQLP